MADSDYSPFDAPVKEPKTTNTPPSETSGGIKMEPITDAELDGKKNDPPPTDAPTFEIPKFDEIPNAQFGGAGDPNAPGSGSGAGPGAGGGASPGGGNTAGDGTKVEPGFMKEFSDFSAKWLVDIFFRLLVNAFRQFAKIDKSEVVTAINQGFIDPRFLTFVDEANEKVDKAIYVSDDEKKFVIEPLKYFLEVKKVQLKPEWMFIIGLLFVGGGIAIRAWDVKQQNKDLLDHMIKESAKWRENERMKPPGGGGKGGPGFYENVENFNSPNGGGGGETFTPPPSNNPNDGKIEVVHAEEVDNDDNAG